MKRYLKLTTQLIDEFDDVKFEQIPREHNSATNEVAKLALTEDALVTTELFIEVQTIPSINGLQTLSEMTSSHLTRWKQRRLMSK